MIISNITDYKMIYREISTAPESMYVGVVWGEKTQRPEYGVASRIVNQWYIHGQSNPHANGRPCANPDGWLPERREEWTKAERILCDILALHPEIAERLHNQTVSQ